jgi:hypothetical protein
MLACENVGIVVGDQEINGAGFEPINRRAHCGQCAVVNEFSDVYLACRNGSIRPLRASVSAIQSRWPGCKEQSPEAMADFRLRRLRPKVGQRPDRNRKPISTSFWVNGHAGCIMRWNALEGQPRASCRAGQRPYPFCRINRPRSRSQERFFCVSRLS